MGNVKMDELIKASKALYCAKPEDLTPAQLHYLIGRHVQSEIADNWVKSKRKHAAGRRAFYFSAEFLMGRMIYNNLYCLGLLDETKDLLKKKGIDINIFEEVDDAALGNGGLGRLAACYLDSAATQEVPLDGYGIRYKYGLFKQLIENGYQVEVADDWQKHGDPWCIRREDLTVYVEFKGQTVKAVPYDMAIIGYDTSNINTLRLWQAEAVEDFNFSEFNNSHYDSSVKAKNDAENISRVLYPNDNTYDGKVLRLKQQYFFCSASLQDIVNHYKAKHGSDYSQFAEIYAFQLNDTHPVSAIPEFVRLLMKDGLTFDEAFEIARKTCSYTNHTVLGEALEKWHADLMNDVVPEIYNIICLIANKLQEELTSMGVSEDMKANMRIVDHKTVHMARLATYVSTYVNGVAQIHTEILKNDVLKEWYQVYPERFQNKTNGITQRRWLGLCNPELSEFITERVGKGWLKDLSKLEKLNKTMDDDTVKKFNKIKDKKKKQLAAYIKKMDGVTVDPSMIFDVQVKRLHEYKRQLINAFSIMLIYKRLKKGELKKWKPTCFIFGAKAAPGYARAKAIIKYINELANLVNNDPDTKNKLQVVYCSNYNVSYAERIVTAADISEQTSLAGTEASGTGNMKFMINGAVTLGTWDGANIEIAEQAGVENEYIFGARVEDVEAIKDNYNPRAIYDENAEIRAVVDTLIDGTVSDGGAQGEGSFAELHKALLDGASWHKADHYFVLYDLMDYVEKKIQANADYSDRVAFGRKCLMNVANSGKFSSDRAIIEYAKDLWHVDYRGKK